MTKAELIELVQVNLAGGDTPDDVKGKYHPEVVAAYIELAIEDFAAQAYRNKRTRAQVDLDVITKTYNGLEIQCDDARGEKYVDIPHPYVNMPMGEGVRWISPQKAIQEKFDKVSSGQIGNLSGLEASEIYELYYIEGQRAYFYNIHESRKMVRVCIIPKFRSLSDDDEVNVPEGRNVELFQTIKGMIREQRLTREDLVNQNPSDFA